MHNTHRQKKPAIVPAERPPPSHCPRPRLVVPDEPTTDSGTGTHEPRPNLTPFVSDGVRARETQTRARQAAALLRSSRSRLLRP